MSDAPPTTPAAQAPRPPGGTRRSTAFVALTVAQVALLGLCAIHAARVAVAARPARARRAATVRALGLTDLCLFTDAPYTRHLALADLHGPLREHPLCLEHFPAGSLAGPPAAIGR